MSVRALLSDHGLHGNNQISGEAQDVLWKLEACKVRIADKPPRTNLPEHRELPDSTSMSASACYQHLRLSISVLLVGEGV